MPISTLHNTFCVWGYLPSVDYHGGRMTRKTRLGKSRRTHQNSSGEKTTPVLSKSETSRTCQNNTNTEQVLSVSKKSLKRLFTELQMALVVTTCCQCLLHDVVLNHLMKHPCICAFNHPQNSLSTCTVSHETPSQRRPGGSYLLRRISLHWVFVICSAECCYPPLWDAEDADSCPAKHPQRPG